MAPSFQTKTSAGRGAARRRFRRLLLPPGWVALGWLLLLGCVAIEPWQHRTGPWPVMQLTMPSIARSSQPNLWNLQSVRRDNSRVKNWRTFRLVGSRAADSSALIRVEAAIRGMQKSTLPNGGVRVSFAPKTSYACFIKVISLMLKCNVKRYWFDAYRKPATFYALTRPARGIDATEVRYNCFVYNCAPPVPERSAVTRIKQVAAEVQNTVAVAIREWAGALQCPEWQASWLLLAAIGTLNGWRWRAARP